MRRSSAEISQLPSTPQQTRSHVSSDSNSLVNDPLSVICESTPPIFRGGTQYDYIHKSTPPYKPFRPISREDILKPQRVKQSTSAAAKQVASEFFDLDYAPCEIALPQQAQFSLESILEQRNDRSSLLSASETEHSSALLDFLSSNDEIWPTESQDIKCFRSSTSIGEILSHDSLDYCSSFRSTQTSLPVGFSPVRRAMSQMVEKTSSQNCGISASSPFCFSLKSYDDQFRAQTGRQSDRSPPPTSRMTSAWDSTADIALSQMAELLSQCDVNIIDTASKTSPLKEAGRNIKPPSFSPVKNSTSQRRPPPPTQKLTDTGGSPKKSVAASPPTPHSQQQQQSMSLLDNIDGARQNLTAALVLVQPEEFRNPSSFLKVYGDPLCSKGSSGGGFVSSGRGGNWCCWQCRNVNYPRRFRCNKCNEVRDAEGDQIVSEYVNLVYQQYLKTNRNHINRKNRKA